MAASTRPDLVERDAELAALEAPLAQARARQDGCVVADRGPGGIGKTRLLAELRAQRRRARRCACSPRAAASSSASSRSASCASSSRRRSPTPSARARAGRRRRAAPRPCSARAGREATAGDASFAALHGLYWLALNLAAERAAAARVDDLHWCDRPSLRFLAYLARRLEGLPVLVAATLRPASRATDPALLGEIAHDPRRSPCGPGR